MSIPILVTGGAGYIGSFVCRALSKMGFNPITFDNLSTGHIENVKWGPLIKGDLLDKKKVNEAFSIYKPKAVLHFAANAIVTESVLNPGKYYENNVQATVNLLETMKRFCVKNIVFSSTCATYGDPRAIPLSETHPQHPINPYGKSKLMVEMILEDYKAFGIENVILRYFNAAGADLEGNLGENHDNETHLIPLLIETAMGLRDSFTIYGTNFPTKDGSAIRDFIHVEDLATAHIKALFYLLQSKKSLTLNLGTGTGYSVKQVIQVVESICGNRIPINCSPRRKNEPFILVSDFTKAEKYLLFKCEHSDIKTIVESAYLWHQKLSKNKMVV